jgi:hypothetical protein
MLKSTMNLLVIGTLLIANSATAKASGKITTFSGNSFFTINAVGYDLRDFTDLEQLGVQRQAEIDAINKCITANAEDCVILNATAITTCNTSAPGPGYAKQCVAKAVARGTLR